MRLLGNYRKKVTRLHPTPTKANEYVRRFEKYGSQCDRNNVAYIISKRQFKKFQRLKADYFQLNLVHEKGK
jgi:hypothetical protein